MNERTPLRELGLSAAMLGAAALAVNAILRPGRRASARVGHPAQAVAMGATTQQTGAGVAESRERPRHMAGHAARTVPSKRIIAGYGFWVFLLSDIIMFAAFFASYAVLSNETAGGPSGRELFSPTNAAVETALLLASSFTCGLASIGAQARRKAWFYGAMAATFALGAAFVLLELREFADLVARGAGPTRSAFLSAFFTLVGCHGLHVSIGLLWLLTMIMQVWAKGFRADILRRVLCFSLFWHALDIIWVAVFTVVYLVGARS